MTLSPYNFSLELRYFADLNSTWPEIYANCTNCRKNERLIQSMREVRVSDDLCVGDVVKRVSHLCHKGGRVGSSSSTSRRKKGGSGGSSVRKQDAPTNMFSLLTL